MYLATVAGTLIARELRAAVDQPLTRLQPAAAPLSLYPVKTRAISQSVGCPQGNTKRRVGHLLPSHPYQSGSGLRNVLIGFLKRIVCALN